MPLYGLAEYRRRLDPLFQALNAEMLSRAINRAESQQRGLSFPPRTEELNDDMPYYLKQDKQDKSVVKP
jgi:hypothetical protein